ncbi:MAG: sodium/proton-translocating pyrophosphatase, partial [Patescibacteria group bacterium]|nr:sodium/proton-translocating pyrophosphatase [Patescibacteria group bacterium]
MSTLLIPIVLPLVAIAFAVYLTVWLLNKDEGTAKMQEISKAIREGASAFIKRQYKTIAIIGLFIAAGLWLVYQLNGKPTLGWQTAMAFAFGAFSSAISGIVGMSIAVRTNLRSASGAKKSFNEALTIALRGGAVSGLVIVSLSLLGVAGLFAVFTYFGYKAVEIPSLISAYAFGASLIALFAQLGGGIYTKAADVGADLVGKIEAGIPEDDPRNPAVIADLVGDNVGDCAGGG